MSGKSQLVTHPQPADEHAGIFHRELPLLGHDALDGFEDVGGHRDIPADVNVAPLLLQGSVHSFRQLLLQDILHVLLRGGSRRTREKAPGWVMLLCRSLSSRERSLTRELVAGRAVPEVIPGDWEVWSQGAGTANLRPCE